MVASWALFISQFDDEAAHAWLRHHRRRRRRRLSSASFQHNLPFSCRRLSRICSVCIFIQDKDHDVDVDDHISLFLFHFLIFILITYYDYSPSVWIVTKDACKWNIYEYVCMGASYDMVDAKHFVCTHHIRWWPHVVHKLIFISFLIRHSAFVFLHFSSFLWLFLAQCVACVCTQKSKKLNARTPAQMENNEIFWANLVMFIFREAHYVSTWLLCVLCIRCASTVTHLLLFMSFDDEWIYKYFCATKLRTHTHTHLATSSQHPMSHQTDTDTDSVRHILSRFSVWLFY